MVLMLLVEIASTGSVNIYIGYIIKDSMIEISNKTH